MRRMLLCAAVSAVVLLCGCHSAANTDTSGAAGERGLVYPNHNSHTLADAERFNKTAKARHAIYTRLADYLVERFDLSQRPGIGLDIGGGPGDLVLELAQRSESFYWINTDINSWNSYLMADVANRRNLQGRTSFMFADACYLPFRDNYADLVVSRGSYQFWGDLETGIREIERVMKPGGWAFIGRGFPPTAPEDEVRELRSGGLAKAPKYSPDRDAARFATIMAKLGIRSHEILRHQPEDKSLNYGVWLCFQKQE